MKNFFDIMIGNKQKNEPEKEKTSETTKTATVEEVIEEEEMPTIDENQIKTMEHRLEVVPKNCKINRFKFMI